MELTQKLLDIFGKLAWEMERPKAYGAFHLIFAIVGISLAVFAAWKLRKLSDKGHRRVLLFVSLFLIATEIFKHFLFIYGLYGGEFPWYNFSFQFCSVPMYLAFLAAIVKPGKLEQALLGFLLYFSTLGGLAAYIEPSGMNNGHWLVTIHSYLWHLLLIFLGLYLFFSRRVGIKWKDYFLAAGMYLGLCGIAFVFNLMLWGPAKGDINMFFIGPKVSSLVIIHDIGTKFGWWVGTLVYIPAVCLGGLLLFGINRLVRTKVWKENP